MIRLGIKNQSALKRRSTPERLLSVCTWIWGEFNGLIARSLFARSLLSVLGALALFVVPPVLCGQEPKALAQSGDYPFTHDPSIAMEDGTYYVFATGRALDGGQFAVRCSKNLTDWKLCGHVFAEIPAWIRESSPRTKDLWAPDISYFNGLYHLYYAYSVFGANTSGIALATNQTLDPTSPVYSWKDEG